MSLFWTFKEWYRDMEVNDDDRAWAKAMPYYIQNEDDKLPPVGRFNFGQKLFFWGIFYCVILLLLTGVALWYTEALPWSWRYVRYIAILIHASVALITHRTVFDSRVHEHDFGRRQLRINDSWIRDARVGMDFSSHVV